MYQNGPLFKEGGGVHHTAINGNLKNRMDEILNENSSFKFSLLLEDNVGFISLRRFLCRKSSVVHAQS